MNYLLQNLQKYYEEVIPRIPDSALRSALAEIVSGNPIEEWPVDCDFSEINNLFNLSLEDAFKKPNFGEKLGKTALSIIEVLDRAIHLEEFCILAFSRSRDGRRIQIIDSASVRLGKLRALNDDLRYHRIRLA